MRARRIVDGDEEEKVKRFSSSSPVHDCSPTSDALTSLDPARGISCRSTEEDEIVSGFSSDSVSIQSCFSQPLPIRLKSRSSSCLSPSSTKTLGAQDDLADKPKHYQPSLEDRYKCSTMLLEERAWSLTRFNLIGTLEEGRVEGKIRKVHLGSIVLDRIMEMM